MKLRIGLILLALFLTGCGPFLFDHPAVGPDGTIAVFLIQDEEGERAYTLSGGSTLTLIHDGVPILSKDVVNDSEAVATTPAWSPSGDELVYIEAKEIKTDDDEYLISSTLYLTDTQPDSTPVPLMVCEANPEGLPLLCQPAFTPEGDITYLRLELEMPDETVIGHLVRYDRSADVHETLLSNVLSYLPATADRPLTVIQTSRETEVQVAHVLTYDLTSGEEEEVASSVLTPEMVDWFYTLPPAFLWDVSPSGQWLALSLSNQLLLSPEVPAEDLLVYLINLATNEGEQLTTDGYAPAFSPSETYLSYIGSEEDGNSMVVLYHLETEAHKTLAGTENVLSLFWIDSTTLGLAVDSKTDWFDLLAYDLETGSLTPLIKDVE